MKTEISTIYLLLFVAFTQTADLPDFIKVCSISDPEINKCAVKSGNAAIPHLVKGIRSYNIPNMMPLKLPFVQLEAPGNFQLNFTDLEIHGLDKAIMVDNKYDFPNQNIIVILDVDTAILKANYNIKGKVLILPVEGQGATTIKILGGRYTFNFHYDLQERNGEEYFIISKSELTFTLKKAEFDFENLFNGDKRLGDEVNKFLNENWQELASEFGTVIGEAVSKICIDISKSLVNAVPFRKIFSP